MIDGWLKLLLLEKMNDGSLLLSINEITHYFKKWTTGSGVLKKIYFLYKNVMLQIDPLLKDLQYLTLRYDTVF